MLDAGNYLGYIDTAVTTESGKNKTPALAITFTVAHRAVNGEWEPLVADQKATVYLFLSEAAWAYTEDKLKKLGFNGDFDAPQWGEDTIANGVALVCKHEEYEGKTRDKWELAIGGGVAKAETNTIAKLTQRWKNNNATRPAGRPASPPKSLTGSPLAGRLQGAAASDDNPI